MPIADRQSSVPTSELANAGSARQRGRLLAQPISGATRLVALLGDPVEHSLSPAIHNHLFASLKLPYAYIPLCVKPHHLATAIEFLRACNFAGANVTVPHKSAALPYCDALSDVAAATGAVNTLYFRDGLLHGSTTDPEGFFAALATMGIDPGVRHVVILGNGGAARTLGFALAMQQRALSLTLAGRNAARAGSVAAEIERSTGFPAKAIALGDFGFDAVMQQCTLLVNCTTVGMHPHAGETPLPRELLHARMAVFDTVYNPAVTRLVAEARQAGCAAENGMRMLIAQGLASFELWTGLRPPADAISPETLTALLEQPKI